MILFAATGDGVARLDVDSEACVVRASLEGSGAQSIARAGEALYAGSRGQGLFRSADGGETWESLDFPQPDVFSVAVSQADGGVYAGCEPSMLFVSRDEGESWQELDALRAIPSAPSWSFPPRPWTSHVRWIAPSPHDGGLLLAGIELGGVMRSEDGGATWSDHRPGAQPDCHSLAWHPTAFGRAYEAAGGGAAWSDDGGASWRPADAGRDRHYTWALAVDPEDPDRWWISASPGPFQAHGRGSAEAVLYRWEGAGPWAALEAGLPQPLEAMPYALAVRDGTLYAGLADGQVYASADGGDSWRALELRGDPLLALLAFA
jgi:photosystem II stability/assembly factor-like uncharacterized protein